MIFFPEKSKLYKCEFGNTLIKIALRDLASWTWLTFTRCWNLFSARRAEVTFKGLQLNSRDKGPASAWSAKNSHCLRTHPTTESLLPLNLSEKLLNTLLDKKQWERMRETKTLEGWRACGKWSWTYASKGLGSPQRYLFAPLGPQITHFLFLFPSVNLRLQYQQK